MSYLSGINIDFYYPLTKWKLLTVDNFMKITKTHYSSSQLRRIFKKKVDEGFLKIFKTPHGVANFYYLSNKAIKKIEDKPQYFYIHQDELAHDSIVSILASNLFFNKDVTSITMEHEFKTRKIYNSSSKIPDFHAEVTRVKKKENIYFEIELTAKSQDRVSRKLKLYTEESRVDKVVYFFTSNHLFRKYLKFLEEEVSEKSRDKFIFIKISDPIINKDFLDNIQFGGNQTIETIKEIEDLFHL